MDDWYADWFGTDYIKLYPHRDAAEAEYQVDFLQGLFQAPGDSLVLDLCCGAGRHLAVMAGRGLRVVGVDLSPALLGQARGLGRGSFRLARCDMRQLPFGPVFDLVTNFFTSFGYFPSDEENRRILLAIAAVLRPGGQFLIDYLNPQQVRASLVPESRDTLPDGSRVVQQRRVDDETGRVEKEILITDPDGGRRSFRESVRLYDRDEMAAMIDDAGLALDAVHGDFSADAGYGAASPRMVLSGHRPAGPEGVGR